MVMEFLSNVWSVMLELSPWLLLGAAVSGVLHVLLPEGFIHRQLTGRLGVLKAVLIGVPLPLCSCGVIPAGISLKRDGASDGASIGFLTATPQTGVDSILVSASFLGWPFALSKVAAALVTGMVGGGLTDLAGGDPGSAPSEASRGAARREGLGGKALDALDHGVDLVRMIWGWLVFGVLVSAAISTWLPAGALSGLGGAGIAAFLAVLAASVPLYVCATASVPIAAALVAGGMPTGAAMVFLMAGPATNVATLGAVRRAFGDRTLAIYLLNIIAGSITFGLGYEALFGALDATHMHAHEHGGGIGALWAVTLAGMMLWFAGEELRSRVEQRRAPANEQLVVGVEGMTCGGCTSRLERQLRAAEGVESVAVSLDNKQAVVVGAISLDDIRLVIEKAGFDPV